MQLNAETSWPLAQLHYPQVELSPFITRDKHSVKHYIGPTTARTNAGTALALLLSGGTRVHCWQSFQRLYCICTYRIFLDSNMHSL